MNDRLLTIGIPTYNGSEYILDAIKSVVAQTDPDYFDSVEILVSDNSSNDGTGGLVAEYAKKSNIRILCIRQDENVGYDRNVDNLFKHASGNFVWLLGDDDYVVDGAVSKIFELISLNEDLSVILLSVQFLDIVTGNTNRMVSFDKDHLCHDGDAFFQKCGWGPAALSSLIIKKADWNSQCLALYFGTQWIHIAAIVHILSANKFSFIVSDIMVVVRVSNDRWEGHFGNQLAISFSYLDILHKMLSLGYSPETYQYFLEDRFKRNLFEIIFLKPELFTSRYHLAKRMIHYYKYRASFWILHLPMLFMPSYCVKLLRIIRRVILNITGKKITKL